MNFRILFHMVALVWLSGCSQLQMIAVDDSVTDYVDIADVAQKMSTVELYTDYSNPTQCVPSVKKPKDVPPTVLKRHSIWERIALYTVLDDYPDNEQILREIRWYQSNPLYVNKVLNRSRRYLYYIVEQLDINHLPLELALLPVVESGYDPFAYSRSHAAGLWQFIPSTGSMFEMSQTWWFDGRRDVIESTASALDYLNQLNQINDGDWALALASYNAGRGTVLRAVERNQRKGKPTDFWSLNLPSETRRYVPKMLALIKIISNPDKYGVELPHIEDKPYFSIVNLESQTSLKTIAGLLDVNVDEIHLLNPGINRQLTPPMGPHRVLVPYESRKTIEKNIDNNLLLVASGDIIMSVESQDMMNVIIEGVIKGDKEHQLVHTVKAGETFWDITDRYAVAPIDLAKWNNISPSDSLFNSQKLVIYLDYKRKVSANLVDQEPILRRINYTVRQGDTIIAIAHKFNVQIHDILKWNSVSYDWEINPGEALQLYVDVTNI